MTPNTSTGERLPQAVPQGFGDLKPVRLRQIPDPLGIASLYSGDLGRVKQASNPADHHATFYVVTPTQLA